MNDQRSDFEAWLNSDIPQFNGELKYRDVNMGLFDVWQACAESMQAEIDVLKFEFTRSVREHEGCKNYADILQSEIDKRDARVAQLEEALQNECGGRCNAEYNPCAAQQALSTSSDTWLAEKIKDAEVKVLEEVDGYDTHWVHSTITEMLEARRAKMDLTPEHKKLAE